MKDSKLHILIVDDHEIVLRGMTLIVREAIGENASVDCASRGNQALELVNRNEYDICLLDIGLPDIDGMSLLRTIRERHPEIKTVVYTVHEELWYVKEYLSLGVNGILFKSSQTDEIKKCILTVAQGDKYYCPRVNDVRRIIGDLEVLTPKESEVLQHIAAGRNTKEIAVAMNISPNTVESHRRHLLTKFDARNVAEMLMNAISQGALNVSSNIRN